MQQVRNLRNTRRPEVIWKASGNYSKKTTVGKGGMQERVGEAFFLWF